MESHDPSPVPDIAHRPEVITCLTMIAPDAQTIYYVGRLKGSPEPTTRLQRYPHGPRAREPQPRDLRFNYTETTTPNGANLACWRIARADIADAIDGNRILFSLSRVCFRTHEAVAWGSIHNWAPRIDEMGVVRLVDQRVDLPWPVARRIEMDYDPRPGKERASFRVFWDRPYQPGEEVPTHPPEVWRKVDWATFLLRVNNSHVHMLPIKEVSESGPIPLIEGLNMIDVASFGGPITHVHVEKRSGNRLHLPPLRLKKIKDRSFIMEHIRSDGAAAIEKMETRRRAGEKPQFHAWETWRAASLGRVHHYFGGDDRLLEVLRDEADAAVAMQREDGTFSGYHLKQVYGRSPAPWAGGAFDSGPAGDLWVTAATLLPDHRDKYLTASQRMLGAYPIYRIEFNHNYSAFAFYHLASHYRLTRDPLALEHALYYARLSVAVDMMPNGFHAAHNFYTGYGAIILAAMCDLCRVLPDDQPMKEHLRELCVRMGNQVLTRMRPDGLFDIRDRHTHGKAFRIFGLYALAFVLDTPDIRKLDRAIDHTLLAKDLSTTGLIWELFAETHLVRYLAFRDRLLAGDKINPMEVI